MSEAPFFSVVIPAYNRASFIVKTLHTVLQQTYQNFEVIVVDDGSTDDTETQVKSVHDGRLLYFKKPNEERGAARNYGVKRSRARYITFLDSDDLLKSNCLAEAAQFIDKNPSMDFFHLGYDVIRSDGKIIYPWKPLPDPANRKLVEGNFLSCLGVFIKREVLMKYPFREDRELSGSEDYELWVRLAARYTIRTCPVSVASLVNHDERSVLTVDAISLLKRIDLAKKYFLEDEKVREYFGRKLNTLFGYLDLYAALHLTMGAHRRSAWRLLYSAFKLYPPMFFNYRFWVVIKKLTVG
ncbi:MAG: glycosyltransferase family 2 protein [Bacteroidota bacterium]